MGSCQSAPSNIARSVSFEGSRYPVSDFARLHPRRREADTEVRNLDSLSWHAPPLVPWNASVVQGHHGLLELSLLPGPSRATRLRGGPSALPDVLRIFQEDVVGVMPPDRQSPAESVRQADPRQLIIFRARPTVERTHVRRTRFRRPWLVAIHILASSGSISQ